MTNQINQDEINAILWKACDTFRGTVDPSEYKNYVLQYTRYSFKGLPACQVNILPQPKE